MNIAMLVGRLTKDPELRYIPGTQTAVTTFIIAIDKGLSRDKKAELEAKGLPTADFLPIVCWGKTAQNVSNFVGKGSLVAVQGRIQTRNYEDKAGEKKYVTEIVASQVEFIEWKEREKKDERSAFNPFDGAASFGDSKSDDFGSSFQGFHVADDDESIPF